VGLAPVLPVLRLRSLHWDVRGLPQATADALPQLSSLTDLQIVSRAGPLPLLQQLTRLARLQQLVVQDRGGYRILWGFLPVPADFPALERYSFHSTVFENLKVRLGNRSFVPTPACCAGNRLLLAAHAAHAILRRPPAGSLGAVRCCPVLPRRLAISLCKAVTSRARPAAAPNKVQRLWMQRKARCP